MSYMLACGTLSVMINFLHHIMFPLSCPTTWWSGFVPIYDCTLCLRKCAARFGHVICLCAVAVPADKANWSTSATATERMLDKPLSLGDRLRFEFGVDPLDDKKSGEQSVMCGSFTGSLIAHFRLSLLPCVGLRIVRISPSCFPTDCL